MADPVEEVPASRIVAWQLGIYVAIVALNIGLWLIVNESAPPWLATKPPRPIYHPPAPLGAALPTPVPELTKYRSDEEATLTTYGQGTGGRAHIPITEAMTLIARRGLPVQPSAPPPPHLKLAPASGGTTQPAGP